MAFGEYFNAMSSFPATAKTAAELRDQNYRYAQARAQGRAYRGSVDPKTGKPIGTAYIQQLISEGVDVDPALAQAARMADIYKQGSEAAQSGISMESTGANPRRTILAAPDEIQAAQTRLDQPGFFGRMFGKAKPAAAQPQAAAPQAEPLRGTTDESGISTNHDYDFLSAPSAAQAQAASKPAVSGPSDIDAHAESSSTRGSENTGVATKPAAEEAPIPAVSGAPGSDRDLGSLGSTRITAPEMGRLPEINVESSAASNPPVDDYFSSMLRDVSLQGAQQAAGVNTQQQPTDDSMFKWAPTDVNGNVYMQYSKALDNFIKSNGYESSSDYLHKTYDAALKQNTPQMPNAMLRAIAPAEYYKQMSAYQAGVQQAQGKAQQAVMEARKGLDEIAKKMGEDTVKQRETELDKDYVLRDKTYRPKAVALLTNRSNIGMIDKDLKAAIASNNIAALRLTAPAVIRAYATALNPDMQLSDGNLREIGAMLSPELATDKHFLLQLAIGLKRSMFNGDDSVLDGLLQSAEQSSGVGLGDRLTKILEHSGKLNDAALGKYVIRITPEKPGGQAGGDDQGLEQPFTVPGSTPTGNPAMQAAGVDPARLKPKTPVKPKPARNPRASSKGR